MICQLIRHRTVCCLQNRNIVNAYLPWNVKKENILYKCGWSPFEGYNFKSRITHTFVNGKLVYHNGKVKEAKVGQRLLFEREL